MAHGERFPLRPPVQIVILWAMVFAFGFALLLSGRTAIAEFRGATVDAEVVGITTNMPGRRVYDVRLVTGSSVACVTKVDSGSNPPPREIHPGGPSRCITESPTHAPAIRHESRRPRLPGSSQPSRRW